FHDHDRLAAEALFDAIAKCSTRSEEHTSELQSHLNLVCRLLLEKKNEHGKRTDDGEPAETASLAGHQHRPKPRIDIVTPGCAPTVDVRTQVSTQDHPLGADADHR